MTPNREDVQVMQAMIDAMVGIPKFSYPARQREAKKPANEFAHIRVLEEYQVGIPHRKAISSTNDTITYQTNSPARLRYRVGVVEDSGIPSSKIMHSWNSEAMKTIMTSTGYGFISCHPLSSEDSLLEKEWEYRKGFSIEMYVTRTFEEVVDRIKELVISAGFVSGSSEYISTIEINDN